MVIPQNNKLCIPRHLQDRTVRLAYQGRQEASKTMALICRKVWFPGINDLVKHTVKHCLPCQTCTKSHQKEPVIMSPLSPGPLIQLSMDFYTLPKDEKVFVVIDDYSRYTEVHLVSVHRPYLV